MPFPRGRVQYDKRLSLNESSVPKEGRGQLLRQRERLSLVPPEQGGQECSRRPGFSTIELCGL